MTTIRVVSKVLFAFWFAFSQLLWGISGVLAASPPVSIDVEPPLIEHERVAAQEAADVQHFIATVVDDDELESVSLYYRFAGTQTYKKIEMQQLSASATYNVDVPTDPEQAQNIEYYIQAKDHSGNRTVRGYAFSPLVREITTPTPSSAVLVPAGVEAGGATSQSQLSLKKVGLAALGVLALGLLVNAANKDSSGEGGAPTPGTNCNNGICQISITIGTP